MKLLIKNARVLDENGIENISDISLDEHKISTIEKEIKCDSDDFIDAKSNYVLPGLIDVSCKTCVSGYEYKEDIMNVSKSAAKGGITTLTASPNTNPIIDSRTVVEYIDGQNKKSSLINIFQYGSMTKNMEGKAISNIGDMHGAGIVAISDGGVSVLDSNLLSNIFRYSTMFELPVITFCDDTTISKNGVVNNGIISTITGLRGMRREAEETLVARNMILAKHTNARLHITNISTKGSVELIKIAKNMGLNVTCDTCPHYFTLTEDYLEDYNTVFKVRPPLRTQEDVEAIVEGLFDGTIDIISSGHSPSTCNQKNTEFDNASFGISSLETAFLVSYNALVKDRKMNFKFMLDKFTKNPAKLLGISNKGVLEEGKDADFFIFDKNLDTTIVSKDFASRAKFSPYDNQTFSGKIKFTIVGGRIVFINQ